MAAVPVLLLYRDLLLLRHMHGAYAGIYSLFLSEDGSVGFGRWLKRVALKRDLAQRAWRWMRRSDENDDDSSSTASVSDSDGSENLSLTQSQPQDLNVQPVETDVDYATALARWQVDAKREHRSHKVVLGKLVPIRPAIAVASAAVAGPTTPRTPRAGVSASSAVSTPRTTSR